MTIQSYAHPAAWSADYRINQRRPAPTPRQPHIGDRFDHLFDLSETVAELRRRGCPAAASFREAAYVVLGDWLDGAIDQEQATAQLAELLADARQALADDDALRADQLADAREHCRATLAAWGADPWDADPAPLTLPRAVALAVGDPAPPVDDGEEDNWGGFRSPRQIGG